MEIQEIVDNMFLASPDSPPPLLTNTEGIYLYDAKGRKTMDCSGGPMTVSIGYGRKEVAEAAAKSIRQVSYALPTYATEPRISLVKRIKKLLPDSLDQVYFCSGGSEANEAAIKLARQYQVLAGRSSKYKVISRNLSYHGMTMFTLSIGDIKPRREYFSPILWDNPRIQPCYCYRCPFGRKYPGCDMDCAFDLEKTILKEGPDTVATFIAEPVVAAAAGALVPPAEYFPIIREICDKYEVLFLADEVVTGFGRTGANMGMDNFGAVPDISIFGKGVSSGYAPLAGMAVSREIVDVFRETKAPFQHLYTFSGHPLVCAVGDEVQRIIEEENLIPLAKKTGRYLGEKLQELKSHPIIGDVRGLGMLWTIEFVKDKKTREPFPQEMNVTLSVLG
ncbi:MAG: aspartate aminotransferase family protein, partial [Deltaproteobacteria bacterium]|nr:aspartate aminotransferase family protein [Deltaproteobacteria bacterium]